ncbi:MAG: YkvA family protein [Chromatiales bacterium]
MTEEQHGFAKEYTEEGFWETLLHYAKLAGRDVVERALQLYYTAQASNVPTWARAVIYGALGYFITPIDAIPDLTPIVGYIDDLGVLVAAMAAVMAYVTPEIMERAAQKAREWFT